MTTIETLEKKLRDSRTELALAQKRLTETIAREHRLSEARAPLSRIANLRGDKAAKVELDENTRELFTANQDAADLRRVVDDIDAEVLALEKNHEQAQHEVRLEQLRALMAERNRLGGVVEQKVSTLCKDISAYLKAADEVTLLANELAIPSTSRHLLGAPMLKDFLRLRLRFLFNEFGWIDPQSRLPLVQLEKDAASSLEALIRQKEAA